MRLLGFENWNTETVRNVEQGLRALRVEEMFALAAAFAVPVVEFLIPTGEALATVEDEHYRELLTLGKLVLGDGGAVGEGGPFWGAHVEAFGYSGVLALELARRA